MKNKLKDILIAFGSAIFTLIGLIAFPIVGIIFIVLNIALAATLELIFRSKKTIVSLII